VGLVTVFFSPEKLFAEQAEKPKWVLPLIASMIVVLIVSVAIGQLFDMGAYVREKMESNPFVAQRLTPQQIEEAAQQANSQSAKIRSAVIAPLVNGAGILIVAGILVGLAMIVDAGTTFKKVLAVAAHSAFAYGVVSGFGGVLVLLIMGDTTGVDIQNIVKLNPTLFLDPTETSKWLYSIATSLDLLSFWQFFLLGLGLSKVSAKLPLGKALGLVAVPWVVWILIKMAIAIVF
jgi:ABC-type multidrug transport system fused ATPase/permease subunit